MENAAEAIKIAFAMMLFVIALTLSISSFSNATRAVDAITTLRDRESDYTYVIPSEDLSRTVGIDTVVSSIYRAYEENIEIYFYEKTAENTIQKMDIYYLKDDSGYPIGTNCIDLAHKNLAFANKDEATEFLNVLLAGRNISNWNEIEEKYENRLLDGKTDDGLYQKFANATFEEKLGEYVQGSGASEITKRVITYIKQP